MPDVLNTREWDALRGTVRARVFSSKREPARPDANTNIPEYQKKALRWNIGYYVNDEDSLYNGERLWESFYWYPELTDADVDAMKVSEQSALRRRAVAREQRLASFGVEDVKDDDAVDYSSFVSKEFELAVTTNNKGRTFIQGVYPIKDETEEVKPDFDV